MNARVLSPRPLGTTRLGALLLVASLAPAAAQDAGKVAIVAGPAFGAFAIENAGPAVSLESSVAVERLRDGRWARVPVDNLYLRSSCSRERLPRCVTAPARERFEPLPWSGMFCNSQCPTPCDLDGAASAGVYRFVVRTCGHETTYLSKPFEKR